MLMKSKIVLLVSLAVTIAVRPDREPKR